MQLPSRPSLEQLKKQAKDLRKAHRLADPEAVRRIRTHLPRLSQTSADDIPAAPFGLQDAQHVIAGEHGFKDWRALQIVADVEFDLLAQLDDPDAQALLREVDAADCTAALKTASAEVKEKLLGNMSARVRGFVESEILRRSDVSEDETRDAQRRILQQTKQCAEAGALKWPTGADAREDVSPTSYERPLDELARCPLDQVAANDLAALWVGLARLAQAEGLEALEKFVDENETSPLVGEALKLAAWGTEPDLIQDLLETRCQMALMPQQNTRNRMVIEALMTFAAGDFPRVIQYKLETFYRDQRGPGDDDGYGTITIDDLLSHLHKTSLAQLEIETLAGFFVDMARVAATGYGHSNDLRALRPLIQALQGRTDLTSELLRRGLELLLEESTVVHLPRPIEREQGEEAEARRQAARRVMNQTSHTLGTQLEVRMAGLERAHQMVITGVVELVKGTDPIQVGRAVRQVTVPPLNIPRTP
jgi:hypothetical protein